MAQEESFVEWMERLKAGDAETAEGIFNRFAGQLVRLAQQKLDRRVRRKLEPEDVVQSVFKSFFVRFEQGRFDLENWNSLWGLLVLITLRKCARKTRQFFGARRDLGKEMAPAPGTDDSGSGWQALARDPSPEEAACFAEVLEELMRGLSDRNRKILELRLSGHTVAEIGAQLGCTEYRVDTALQTVKTRLQQLQDREE